MATSAFDSSCASLDKLGQKKLEVHGLGSVEDLPR